MIATETDAQLSRLLFWAREEIEMYADILESVNRRVEATAERSLVAQIDAYRAERGWSANGFGGETHDARSTGQ